MYKSKDFIGIDVSKNTFDVWSPGIGHLCLNNDKKGFKEFYKHVDRNSWCVMEGTGTHHYLLSHFLHQKGLRVSMVNPLVIKRYIQMKLQYNKTDKSDTKMIAMYAQEQPLEQWEPDPADIEECKMLNTAIALYLRQGTALKNKLHSLNSKGAKGFVMRSLKRQIRVIQKEVSQLEGRLEDIIKEHELKC